MYDFAHPLSDAIEGVTHSLCSLEFTDHRPLYDWCIANCSVPHHPEQTEFGRVGLTYTVMSKRWMKRLVDDGHVRGWDDPRMATLAAQRRRGVPPAAFHNLSRDIGLTRRNITVELPRYEHAIRSELNKTAPRVMAVLNPLRVVIENLPEDAVEHFDAVNNPEDPAPARARSRSRACSTSSATTSSRTRRRSSSAWRPDARCDCARRA